MSEPESHDIVICGGGVVGLTLAACLDGGPWSVLLLDAQAEPREPTRLPYQVKGTELVSGISPRVSALNPSSLALFERLGVIDQLLGCPFRNMLVRDGRGSASIEFDAEAMGKPALGSIVENTLLIRALINRLQPSGNVELRWETPVTDITLSQEGPCLKAGDTQVMTSLLVGADGGQSRVREAAGIRAASWPYGQEAVVATILTEQPHEHTARQWFTERGPLAFLPLAPELTPGGAHLHSIVFSSASAPDLAAMGPDEFCTLLTGASESELGRVLATDQRFHFPLHQQHAFRYVKPGLALVGDAAHTIHPLAGQGANLGIADAKVLASELQQARFSDELPGDINLLNRYVQQRQPHNLLMTAAMEGFKRLYDSGNPAVNWARNLGLRLVNDAPGFKHTLARLAMGD